jgi:hypothetical protein
VDEDGRPVRVENGALVSEAAAKDHLEQAWRAILAEQFPGGQGDSAKLS